MDLCLLVVILMVSHHRTVDTNSHHMGQVVLPWDLNLPWGRNRRTCTCNMDRIRTLHHKDLLGLTMDLILVDPCMDNEEVHP